MARFESRESRDHRRRAAYGPDGEGTFYVIVSERTGGFGVGNTPVSETDTWEAFSVADLEYARAIVNAWIHDGATLADTLAVGKP